MGSNLGGIRWRIEGPGCAGENSDICAAVAPLPITGLGPMRGAPRSVQPNLMYRKPLRVTLFASCITRRIRPQQ